LEAEKKNVFCQAWISDYSCGLGLVLSEEANPWKPKSIELGLPEKKVLDQLEKSAFLIGSDDFSDFNSSYR